MVRKTWVDPFDRTYPSGKTVRVKGKRGKGFARKVPFDPKKFEPLSDEWAKEFIEKRLYEKHPDTLNTSRVVFLHPNPIWAENTDRFDVLYLDTDNIPEYNIVPEEAYPDQIIKVKGKFYIGNFDGKFERGFPPKLEKSNPNNPNNPSEQEKAMKKFFETTEAIKEERERLKSKGLFEKAKYEKYADIVSFKSPEESQKSVIQLKKEFDSAKTLTKKKRVASVAQLSTNRSRVIAEKSKISDKERKEFIEIAQNYEKLNKELWKTITVETIRKREKETAQK